MLHVSHFWRFLLQAYTNELELEVAHLMEENARLKRQQEQVNNHEMDPPFLGVPLLSFEHFGVLHHKVAGRFLLVYLTLMPIFFLSFFFWAVNLSYSRSTSQKEHAP